MKEFTLAKNINHGGFFDERKINPYTGHIHIDGTKKVRHCVVSGSLKYFTKGFMANYNLLPLQNKNQAVIMFGMYTIIDYVFFAHHRGPIILVWCGRDASRIPDRWAYLLKTKVCKHIATHVHGSKDLRKKGIKHEVWPITPGKIDLQLAPRGDNLYWYGHETMNTFYGGHYLDEIERRTKIKIIKAGPKTYDKKQLTEVYKSSFLALRLTKYDGVPTTVLEMGFMGRKSIFNGAVPHCIQWKGVDDICQKIMREYETRHDDNAYIADDIRKFMDIGDKWMYI